MRFEVTIIGSSSASPSATRHNSAHALNVHEQFYLIDCGEATQIQMRRYGLHLLKFNVLFLSHLHGDHLFGLPGLLSTMNLLGRRTPFIIYGVKPLSELIDFYKKHFGAELNYEIICREPDVHGEGLIYENKVMEVSYFPMVHRIPAIGYLFREKTPPLNVDKFKIEKYGLSLPQILAAKRGEDIVTEEGLIRNEEITYRSHQPRSYAYCSDTAYSEKVIEYVKGVDLLYHESTFTSEEAALAAKTGHSTARQAAEVALKAGVKQLLLGHFSSRYKDESVFIEEAAGVFTDTILAKEGETISVKIIKNPR